MLVQTMGMVIELLPTPVLCVLHAMNDIRFQPSMQMVTSLLYVLKVVSVRLPKSMGVVARPGSVSMVRRMPPMA